MSVHITFRSLHIVKSQVYCEQLKANTLTVIGVVSEETQSVIPDLIRNPEKNGFPPSRE